MFSSEKNIEILKKALDVIEEEEIAALPSKEELAKITFSPEFERKMEKLIRQESRPYYRLINTVGKRVACWIIAVIIALTAVTFSVEAIREPVIEFFVKTFEKFSVIFYNEEDISEENPIIEEYYAPTYLPEGYTKVSEEKLLTTYRIQYKNDVGNKIYFRQVVIDSHQEYLDTENASVDRLYVNGKYVYYIVKTSKKIVVWNDAKYSFTITTSPQINKEKLLQIIDSIMLNQ